MSKAYTGLIAVNNVVNIAITIPSKSGYTAKVAVYSGNSTSAHLLAYDPCKIVSGTSVSFGIYNAGSYDGGNVSSTTLYAGVLYIKNTV